MEKNYVSPFIEVIEVEVEEGFAISVVVSPNGSVNDFTTNSFGAGGGGSTMICDDDF